MNLVADAVRVFVTDLEVARRFYQETLGLRLETDGSDHGILVFEPGPLALVVEALEDGDPEAAELVGRFVGLSFRVPDVESAHRELAERGVEFVAAPKKQWWGSVLAHFRDPERNVLSLVG